LPSIYDDDYYITEIGNAHIFPNAREGSDEGLLAYGGDLNPNRLLTAYRNGIFPWFSPNDPILQTQDWYSIQMSLKRVNHFVELSKIEVMW